jgi:quercetin dioxygenase-like cupin family protein
MKVSYKKIDKEIVQEGVYRIWLIDERVGAKNFFMRMFEIMPGKSTKPDRHPYEHEIFILRGKGTVEIDNNKIKVGKWDAVYIAPNQLHSIQNVGKVPLQFLCMVPKSYRDYKKKVNQSTKE